MEESVHIKSLEGLLPPVTWFESNPLHKGFVPVWSMNRYRKVSLQRRQAGRRIRKQNKPRKWEVLCRTGPVTFKTLTFLNERT